MRLKFRILMIQRAYYLSIGITMLETYLLNLTTILFSRPKLNQVALPKLFISRE